MINRCTPLQLAVKPLLLYSVCYRAFLIQIMDYSIVDEKGNIVGTIRETYPVRFVDPEREYDVNYLAPHQSLTRQREEGYFTLKGKDLTQNQIWQLFLLGSL
jgi:hypothetical protein